MIIRKPPYFDDFSCLAGACPDTCCAAWEAVVDEAALARYQTLEGSIGAQVREALTVDGDGDTCFRLVAGRCALLREDHLCALQARLGEEALCQVCREHPRFIEEYGPFREVSLAASCPAAAELMLTAGAGTPYIETEDGGSETVCEDVDDELLHALLPCRERLFGLLLDKGSPVEARLAAALGYAGALQEKLDWGDVAGLAQVLPPPPPIAAAAGERLETVRALFGLLGELELLSGAWKTLLEETSAALEAMTPAEYAARRRAFAQAGAGHEGDYENFLRYLFYRWFLRGVFDGDVYGRVCFAALSLLVLQEMEMETLARRGRWDFSQRVRLVGLWCKEQEHCEENLSQLARWAYDIPAFGPEALGRIVQAI